MQSYGRTSRFALYIVKVYSYVLTLCTFTLSFIAPWATSADDKLIFLRHFMQIVSLRNCLGLYLKKPPAEFLSSIQSVKYPEI